MTEKAMTVVKKSGVKLHIAVDVLGLPYAAIVTTANISDIAGGIQMFSQPSFYSFSTVKTVLCDGTYEAENFAKAIKELIGADVEVAKRSQLHTFAVIPKRRIVERSFGWIDKCRRLWKNCERKLENTLNMVKFAFLRVLLWRF
jgi:transposase